MPISLRLIPALAGLGAATTAVVYIAFSTVVMPRLAGLSTEAGVRRMQQFNRTALQAPFMTAFLGTTVLAGLILVRHWRDSERSTAATAGALVYLLGVGVTIAWNVPRNDRLAALDPTSGDAAQVWARYVHEWTGGNTVRAVLSTGAAIALLGSSVMRTG